MHPDGRPGRACVDRSEVESAPIYALNDDGVAFRGQIVEVGALGPNGDVGGLGLYDSWSVMGFFHADPTNPNEPIEGFEGMYSPFPLWIWSY